MSLSDCAYVREQYGSTSNLEARMQLHALFIISQEGWFPWLFRHLDVPDQARILELGCGTGQFWREHRDQIPPGWFITLTDQSTAMVEEARVHLSDHPSFSFAVMDAQRINQPESSFSAVIANFMLYHVPDRDQAYSEVHRVLTPGGHFYASTVGEAHMAELDELIARNLTPPAFVRDSASFTLETGEKELREYFDPVTRHVFEDELRVTEVEPLLAYIKSQTAYADLSDDAFASLAGEVRGQIEREGAFRIQKASGLFVAVKPPLANRST